MSDIYLTEPPTEGKVLIKTSQGDIDIGMYYVMTFILKLNVLFVIRSRTELWPKEAPLACRNFVQLALEGYYDSSPIHRIVKDFMV